MSDLSFILNLPDKDKMEMAYELAHSMFKVNNIFSIISAGRGDVWPLEVIGVNSLKEVMEIHGFPSDLNAHVTGFEGSLEDAEKRCKTFYDSVKEKTRHMEEHHMAFL
ncbi:unnamed protein product [Vicia faba]|uniref:Uncharacterized protein n=1 Tax=Vicia faba TaxID=3906 RepID=A0AAV0YWI1_VICFA|nr:unnamed protein product [Vicia faba]